MTYRRTMWMGLAVVFGLSGYSMLQIFRGQLEFAIPATLGFGGGLAVLVIFLWIERLKRQALADEPRRRDYG